MTRRGFIRGLAQGAAAAALVAVAGVLGKRAMESGAGAGTANCDNRFICRACGRLTSCGLPQAMSAREALGVRPESGRAT